MGFGVGKDLLDKPAPKVAPAGVATWSSKHVAIEAHAFLTHKAPFGLPAVYKAAAARHYHVGTELTSANRQYISDYIVTKFTLAMAGISLHFEGSPLYDVQEAPAVIELILEQDYDKKALCSEKREKERSDGFCG